MGANYRAAGRARSKAEFIAKMGIVVEEVDETVFWIECLIESEIVKPDLLTGLCLKPMNCLRSSPLPRGRRAVDLGSPNLNRNIG